MRLYMTDSDELEIHLDDSYNFSPSREHYIEHIAKNYKKSYEKKGNFNMEETIKKTKEQTITGTERVVIDMVVDYIMTKGASFIKNEKVKVVMTSKFGKVLGPLVLFKLAEMLTQKSYNKAVMHINSVMSAGASEYTQQVVDIVLNDTKNIVSMFLPAESSDK